MTDELAQRRAQRELPHAFADVLDVSRRLADELRRLGEGVEALADEWDATDEHGNPLREGSFGEAADELRALLRGQR